MYEREYILPFKPQLLSYQSVFGFWAVIGRVVLAFILCLPQLEKKKKKKRNAAPESLFLAPISDTIFHAKGFNYYFSTSHHCN